jgi:hypothetical protein
MSANQTPGAAPKPRQRRNWRSLNGPRDSGAFAPGRSALEAASFAPPRRSQFVCVPTFSEREDSTWQPY